MLAPTTFCLGKIGTKLLSPTLYRIYTRESVLTWAMTLHNYFTPWSSRCAVHPHINWTKYMFDCFKCNPQRHHPFKQNDFIPWEYFNCLKIDIIFLACIVWHNHISPQNIQDNMAQAVAHLHTIKKCVKMNNICTCCKAHDMKEGVGVGFVL